jgi:hypothetical protein
MADTSSEEEARDSFYISRAEVINAYNLMEQGLTLLFATVLGTNARYATLIISKIINTRARNEVVQNIVDHRTQKRFRVFTNSLFSEIATIDRLRNQIVHWRVDVQTGEYLLRPANIMSDSPERISESDLDEVWGRATYLAGALKLFNDFIQGDLPDPAWLDRFSRPLTHPPEPDDLLNPLHEVPSTPPRS